MTSSSEKRSRTRRRAGLPEGDAPLGVAEEVRDHA